jgi:hypothetical protein
MTRMTDKTTIFISKNTHSLLKTIGNMGESFDMLVFDLVQFARLHSDGFNQYRREIHGDS